MRLTEGEQERAWRQYTSSPEAYDHLLRGWEHFNRSTKEANAQARQMFEKAIELDPTYAVAYSALAWAYWLDWGNQWSQDPQNLERAFTLAQKAIALDDSLSMAHLTLGQIYTWRQQHDQAIAEGERALVLASNCADCYAGMAAILNLSQRPAEAVGLVEKAMRLNPQYPGWYLYILGYAYRVTGRYEEAVEALKNALARRSSYHLFVHLNLPTKAHPSTTLLGSSRGSGSPADQSQSLCRGVRADNLTKRSSDNRAHACRPAQGGAEVSAQ